MAVPFHDVAFPFWFCVERLGLTNFQIIELFGYTRQLLVNLENGVWGLRGSEGPFLTIQENGKCHKTHTCILIDISTIDQNMASPNN